MGSGCRANVAELPLFHCWCSPTVLPVKFISPAPPNKTDQCTNYALIYAQDPHVEFQWEVHVTSRGTGEGGGSSRSCSIFFGLKVEVYACSWVSKPTLSQNMATIVVVAFTALLFILFDIDSRIYTMLIKISFKWICNVSQALFIVRNLCFWKALKLNLWSALCL